MIRLSDGLNQFRLRHANTDFAGVARNQVTRCFTADKYSEKQNREGRFHQETIQGERARFVNRYGGETWPCGLDDPFAGVDPDEPEFLQKGTKKTRPANHANLESFRGNWTRTRTQLKKCPATLYPVRSSFGGSSV